MDRKANRTGVIILVLVALGVPMHAGCVTLDLDSARTIAKVVSLGSPSPVNFRKTPRNPLSGPLNLIGWFGPKPTERTMQTLRRFALDEVYDDSINDALAELHRLQQAEPSLEKLHALAELTYIRAKRLNAHSDDAHAKELFGSSMAYAYEYLFDPRYDRWRNRFDPEFRSASDLYNGSLEGLLRILRDQGNLRPGYHGSLNAVGKRLDFVISVRGPWHDEDFERFEFASDYEVTGLPNIHRTFGLGVPLIAVRKAHPEEGPDERFYPPGITFAVTAFFRLLPSSAESIGDYHDTQRCALELIDPMDRTDVTLNNQLVPLESDITTPLAYYLDDPLIGTNTLATFSLLDAEFGKQFRGLYMLEPFDPNRIPVIMVHGLWSSPVTWMEMFNDLRSLPEISSQYQFWFYMYPTGQPFWLSAQQMRADLANAIQELDPDRHSDPLHQMVLVGHSMGGLVSRLQTMYSDDRFWRIVSDSSFQEGQGNDDSKRELAELMFFEPNPSIRRVITIGTPHRGSQFANSATRWLSHRFFTLPRLLRFTSQEIVRDNPNVFRDTELLTINTSIDSLAPDSPILPAMLNSRVPPWVRFHNIYGRTPESGWLAKIGTSVAGDGDGVVSLASASLDDVESQIEVPADHTSIHAHPRTILEVRRILLKHLAEMRGDRIWDSSILPAVFDDKEHPVDEKINWPSSQLPQPESRPSMIPAYPSASNVPILRYGADGRVPSLIELDDDLGGHPWQHMAIKLTDTVPDENESASGIELKEQLRRLPPITR